MTGDRVRTPTCGRSDLRGRSFTVLELAARNHDVGARRRQPLGHAAADAAAAPRDQRDLPAEVEQLPWCPHRLRSLLSSAWSQPGTGSPRPATRAKQPAPATSLQVSGLGSPPPTPAR